MFWWCLLELWMIPNGQDAFIFIDVLHLVKASFFWERKLISKTCEKWLLGFLSWCKSVFQIVENELYKVPAAWAESSQLKPACRIDAKKHKFKIQSGNCKVTWGERILHYWQAMI